MSELIKDDFFKILYASMVSGLTAILSVTPDYQFFKVIERDFWNNLFRIGGNIFTNGVIALIIIGIITELVHLLFTIIDKLINPN